MVFSATRAYRRSSVEGGNDGFGLFINTLPLRVRVNPESPASVVERVARQWMAMRGSEYTPLVKIQGWAGRQAVLLFSIMVFENFHLDTLLRTQGGSWSTVAFASLQNEYPITWRFMPRLSCASRLIRPQPIRRCDHRTDARPSADIVETIVERRNSASVS
jgi:hypothetical protein